jgi:hypothetical protein
MSKEAWKVFLAWLDLASEAELKAKHRRCLELQQLLTDEDLSASLRRMIRLIEEEQLIRIGIAERRPPRRR